MLKSLSTSIAGGRFSNGLLQSVVIAVLVLSSAVLLAGLAEAQRSTPQTRSFTFYVREGWLTMPDGAQVYVWGFTDDPNGAPMVPGPPIVVDEGDTVEITLVNDRDPTANALQPNGEGHTIHLHGLDVPTEHDGVPETHPAGLVRQGSSFTYRFVASHAGTYFYHCHQNNVEHQQMGMYGPLIVRAAGGASTAYTNGPAHDREHTLVLAELGAEGHQQAHRTVKEGAEPYNWLGYRPDYFLLSDQAHADPSSVVASLPASAGERVLVRVINAGYIAHAIHTHDRTFRIVATDGRPWPTGPETDTIWLGPGEKYDLLFDGNATGAIVLHDHVDQPYAPPTTLDQGTDEPGAAVGSIREFKLYVRDGWLTMPDDAQVYVYGFTDDPNGAAQVPGPPLVARQGETVRITLVNDRDPISRGHELRLHTPNAPEAIRALVGPGGSHTYEFVASQPGTFFYSGQATPFEDQQMGMYGSLVIEPASPTADFSADQDLTFVLSEIDAPGHERVRQSAESGETGGWAEYAPNYFLINGLAYPDTERHRSTMVHAKLGERILIRMVNAGQIAHAMHLHGYHFKLVAANGRPWPEGPLKDTVLIGPGETYDVLFVADQTGSFPLHDHFETANTNNGVWLGGMHTMVMTTDAAAADSIGSGHHHAPASSAPAPSAPAPSDPAPAATGSAPAAPPTDAALVAVRDNFYTPNRVTIPVGGTVQWEHQGHTEHTVSSLVGLFDSGTLTNGDTFHHTFTAPGRYDYFCRFHITNRGTIIVQ